MADESKIQDLQADREAANEILEEQNIDPKVPTGEEEDEDEDEEEGQDGSASKGGPADTKSKKKKSKRKRIKAAFGVGPKDEATQKADLEKAASGLSKAQITELLALNPALAQELMGDGGDLSGGEAAEAMKKLSLQDIMTGLAAGGKNVKDMGAYKFWATQPVPKFGEQKFEQEGPFKIVDPEKVPKEPASLPEGYEWVTMDLTDETQLKEVCDLLSVHYVEDVSAMFRLNYSQSFLKW
jgi:glycylpeptide N-tetradecanoyltransferase